MLTFKQWLVRQYGTATIQTTPRIVTKSSNTTSVKLPGGNS
jgi:hypothetical protein